jgi:translation elongation factor P/translation initiation factor 5A
MLNQVKALHSCVPNFKNLNNGKIVDHTFNSGVKIDVVRIETREYQYLYKDESGYNFHESRRLRADQYA